MPFALGDRVEYLYAGGGHFGTVTAVDGDFVGVTLDVSSSFATGCKRAFNQDGIPAVGRGSYTRASANIVPAPASRFNVGDRVVYVLNASRQNAVVEHVSDFVGIRVDNDQPLAGARRAFTLTGEAISCGHNGYPGPDSGSRIEPEQQTETNTMFKLGDRAVYIYPRPSTGEEVRVEGEITAVERYWVGLTIDQSSTDCPGERRSFNLDGSYCTAYSTSTYSYGHERGRLELLDLSKLEYPPEPVISYGVFTADGADLPKGFTGPTRTGYGVINLPVGVYTGVYPAMPDEGSYEWRDLQDYLNYAKERWERACRRIDWDRTTDEDRWQALIGCELHSIAIRSDHVELTMRAPKDGDWSEWDTLILNYDRTCVVPGIKTAAEIDGEVQVHRPVTLTSIDGEVLTLSTGMQFALLPRYLEMTNQLPTWNLPERLKTNLMRNLDTVRAQRDSQPLAA